MIEEPTFQDLLAQFSDEVFVGRQEQLALFEQLFAAGPPPFLILAVAGPGGVGKTTLLEQFQHRAARHGALTALVNEDQATVVEVLAALAAQFDAAGYPLTTFTERHRKYRELKEQVEADPQAPKGLFDFLIRGATRVGLRTLRRVPLAGDVADVFLSPEAEEQVVEQGSAFAEYVRQRFTNKDERQLLLETDQQLTTHLLHDLNRLAGKRVILCFDTFEKTAPALDNWLRDLLSGKFGRFSSRFTFVIAGRYALGQRWTPFRRALRQVELAPFTPAEARDYLARNGITEPAEVEQIIEISERLPVLLALLTATPGTLATGVASNAVERFLQGLTPEQYEAALASSVPRFFDQDILAAVLGAALARSSAAKLYAMFLDYKAQADFVGMDMARKFLQMGYTRARRYANHCSGRKYAADGKTILPQAVDTEKAAAQIFYEQWQIARTDPSYLAFKQRHRAQYEQPGPATKLPQDHS